MQQQAEEIVLLPTNNASHCSHKNQASCKLKKNNDNHVKSNKSHQDIIRRLLKSNTANRQILYKNLFLWIILFGCMFLLAAPLALHFSYLLPAVKPRTIPLHEFSEERARDYYINLTEHGPRIVNTRADYLTRDFLISEINRIRDISRKFIRFDISLQNFSHSNIDNLQNIAVRVSNFNSSSNTPCLMLTAHYDSVEFSPGGSDDGSGVVILLELLSNLVNDSTITFSDVHLIVLFTTAEEMSLLGAKLFVMEHPWKKDVRRFINLDSVGGNEKAILFRVKPSQLVNDYKQVPRPHANVIGDDIFKWLEFTTDYDAFIIQGFLLGYDFAFYLDGYKYHTSMDQPSNVEDGALQHLGENTLVLSRNILRGDVNLRQPETIIDDENLIYFDILGQYLISYRISTSVIIQSILISLVILVGMLGIFIDHIRYNNNMTANDFSSVYFYFKYPLAIRILFIVIFLICYPLSILFGIIFSLFTVLVMKNIRPLSWYGNSALAFFLYGLPCLIGIVLGEILWTHLRRVILSKYPKKSPMEINAINHIDRLCLNFERYWALLLIFVFLISFSIYTGTRSLYFILLWSIFIIPMYLMLIIFEFSCRWLKKNMFTIFNEQGWYWLFAPYVVSLIPLVHTLEMSSRLVRLAIPIMGKMLISPLISQDFIICVLILIPAILFFLIFIPNIQRLMNYSRALIILIISFFIVFTIAYTRQIFTNTHPKLIQIQHMSRSVYKLDNPTKFPINIPVYSHKELTTVQCFDNLVLSPTLDQISNATGFLLKNRSCSSATVCSFDNTFNRTIPFQHVELTSMNNFKNYRFTIQHVSSYCINLSIASWNNVTMHNSSIKPRTETIIDIELTNVTESFSFELEIKRCDLNDSSFLLSLTEKLSHIVLLGSAHCQAIRDILAVYINH